MKKILLTATILFIGFFEIFAQCKSFTNETVVPALGDYLLTGKYHALKLSEGEEILIFKTINRGINYRFVVMSDDNIPQPQFMIIDWENNLIFDNTEHGNTNSYDYVCQKTQRIKIVIKVPRSTEQPQINEGCVSLVMGIKSSR